ncbi:MAG: hypothetical protein SH809_02560 [Rhodothermales bacterium]|nr:hypothetical protein [Rhodothermales bacterium]
MPEILSPNGTHNKSDQPPADGAATDGRSTSSRPPVTLYGANDRPLELPNIEGASRGAGRREPFDKSFLDGPKNWFSKHGPALANLLLMGGSATGTVATALRSSHAAGLDSPLLVASVMILAGLVIECGFAWAWSRQGTHDLAGRQRVLADRMFKMAAAVMVGDLSLSLAEVAFGVGGIAPYWIGGIQPAAAVWIVYTFYAIKGAHPEHLADLEIVDLRADAKAAAMRDRADAFRLALAERKHERALKWAALDTRQEYAEKLVTGRWFRRRVKGEVKKAVGQNLLGDVRRKLGELPRLLGIGKARQN